MATRSSRPEVRRTISTSRAGGTRTEACRRRTRSRTPTRRSTSSRGEQILYFGADRFAQNGSADFGFWFFRSEVSTNADGTFSGVHAGTPTHSRRHPDPGHLHAGWGDLEHPRVRVGRHRRQRDVQRHRRGTDRGVRRLCSWLGQRRGLRHRQQRARPGRLALHASQGAGGSIPSGGFVEGGIDLTDLGLAGCFRSFMAETRSSPSVDATLKDFVLGNFEACDTT